jgi:tRNA(Ile)-lysidine synthase
VTLKPNKVNEFTVEQKFKFEIELLIAEHSLEGSAFFVACSGGMDSCVLLNLMAEYSRDRPAIQLHALHYNHCLQDASNEWQTFARKTCKQLNIPFKSTAENFEVDKSKGVEASARDARYKWFDQCMDEICQNDREERTAILLTAHHCDDQAETMLMNMMRGTGLKGLRGIASYKKIDNYYLARPLLEFTKCELTDFAKQSNLKWIEDPSNADVYFKRNAIRHQVMPQLNKLHPNSAKQFMKLSHRIVDSENILHEVANSDLNVTELFEFCPLDYSYGLSFKGLRHLSVARQLNAIRYWLDEINFPAESEMDLLKVLDWSINGASSTAELRRGYRVYRYYQDALYVMPSEQKDFKIGEIVWADSSCGLELVDDYTTLQCIQVEGEPYSSLSVKQRINADTILLNKGVGHINPKNCLQEASVPPWRRGKALFIADKNNCFVGLVGGVNLGEFMIVSPSDD